MEISPWLHHHPQAVACQYRGTRLAAQFAGAAADAPFPPAALCDWSFRAALRVQGPDARKWLNGIITANVRDLAPGRTAPSFLLNPKGHILAAFDTAALSADEFLLLASEDQRTLLLETLRRFVFRSRLVIEDLSAGTLSLAVCGPGAAAALRAAGGDDLPAVGGWRAAHFPGGADTLRLLRWQLGQIETVEIYGNIESVVPLYDTMARHATPIGAAAWDRRMLLEGIPLFGREIRDAVLPPETGSLGAIGNNKGCYIGQEIVERIRARGQVHRQLQGFRFAGAVQAGERIQADGKDVGELTAAAALTSGAHAGQYAALGYLRREAAESAAALTAAGVAGTVARPPLDE